EVEFREADFWVLLPEIAAAMDDPTADYAILPTYKLAAEARAAGLKVILSGEGGDELFAGYGRYRSVLRPWWAGGRAPPRPGPLVADQPCVQGLCDPAAVTRLCAHARERRLGFAAWTLLFYARWHRHHMRRRPAAGDVFAALGDRGRAWCVLRLAAQERRLRMRRFSLCHH